MRWIILINFQQKISLQTILRSDLISSIYKFDFVSKMLKLAVARTCSSKMCNISQPSNKIQVKG